VRVVWLDLAEQDRDAHFEYVAENESVRRAVSYDEKIGTDTMGLADNPKRGREGRKKGTREIVVVRTPFIAVYRVKPRLKRIEIIRLLHGAQLWP
jgi:toxin ParE1/3/4